MHVTHLGHSCLLVEIADRRILIDPGAFSSQWHGQRDLDMIVITHQHPDHVDPDRIVDLARANPRAEVRAEGGAAGLVRDLGAEAGEFDGEVRLGDVTVTAVGDQHALIHEDIPRIGNRGVRLSADGEPVLFHPGDALDAEPGEVDVLAVPLNAPWQRSREMTAFLRRLAAPVAIPIHDALLSATGRGLYLKQARDLGCADTDLRDLADAGATPFTL